MPGLPSRFGSSTRTTNEESPQSLDSNDTSWGFDSKISRHGNRYGGRNTKDINERRRNSKLSRKSYVTKDKRVAQMEKQSGGERRREFQDVHLCERLRLDLLHSLRDRELLMDKVQDMLPHRKKQIALSGFDTTTSDTDVDGIDQTRPTISRKHHKYEEETVPLHSFMNTDLGLTGAVAADKNSNYSVKSWENTGVDLVSPRGRAIELGKERAKYQKSNINEVSYIVPRQLDSSSIFNSITKLEDTSIRRELRNADDMYNLTEIILHYEAESHGVLGRSSKSSHDQHVPYPAPGSSICGPRNSTPILNSKQAFHKKGEKTTNDKRRSSSYVQDKQKKLRDQQYWYQKIREYRSFLEMDISQELRLYVEQCYFFAVEQLVSLWGDAHVSHSGQYDTKMRQRGDSTKRVSFKGEVSFEPGHNLLEREQLLSYKRAVRREPQCYLAMKSSAEDSYSDCSTRDYINDNSMEFSPRRYVSSPERSHHGQTSSSDFLRDEVNRPNEQFDSNVRVEDLTELLGLNSSYPRFHGTDPVRTQNGVERECAPEPEAIRGDPRLSGRPFESNHQDTAEPVSRISVERERLTFLAQLAQLEQNLRESKRDVKKQLLSEPSPRKRKMLEDHYMDICHDLSSVERRMKEVIQSLGLDELKVRSIIEYQLDDAEERRKEGIDFFMGLVEGDALEEESGGVGHDLELESGIGSANQSIEIGMMHDEGYRQQLESRLPDLAMPSMPRNGGSVERARVEGSEDVILRQEVKDLREKLSTLERSIEEGTGKQVNDKIYKDSQTVSPSEGGKKRKERQIQGDTSTGQQNIARFNLWDELGGNDRVPSSSGEANDRIRGENPLWVSTYSSERSPVLDYTVDLEGVENSSNVKDSHPGIQEKDGNNNIKYINNVVFGIGDDAVHKMDEHADDNVMNQSSLDGEQSLNNSKEITPLKTHLDQLREQRLRYFDNKQMENRAGSIDDEVHPCAKLSEKKSDISEICHSNDGSKVFSPKNAKNSIEKGEIAGNFSIVEDRLDDHIKCSQKERIDKPSFELEVGNRRDSDSIFKLTHTPEEEESDDEPLLEDYRQALEEKDRETGSEAGEPWDGTPDARKLQQTSERQFESPHGLNHDSLDCEQPDILSLASTEHVSFDESITDLLSVEELELLDTLDRLTPGEYSIVTADKIVNNPVADQSQMSDSTQESDGYSVEGMEYGNFVDTSECQGRSDLSDLPNASSKEKETILSFDEDLASRNHTIGSACCRTGKGDFLTDDEFGSSEKSFAALNSEGEEFNMNESGKDCEMAANKKLDKDIEVDDTDQLSWLEEDIVTVIDVDDSDCMSNVSSYQSFQRKLPCDKSEIIFEGECELTENEPFKEDVEFDEFKGKEVKSFVEDPSVVRRDKDNFPESVESFYEEELPDHDDSMDKAGNFALNEAAKPSADHYQCDDNRSSSPDHIKSHEIQLNVRTDVTNQNEADDDFAPVELNCKVAKDSGCVSSPSVDCGILENHVDYKKEIEQNIALDDPKENQWNDVTASDCDIHKQELISEGKDDQKDPNFRIYTSQGEKETCKDTKFENEIDGTAAAAEDQEEVKSKREKLLSPYLLEQCGEENLTTEEDLTFGDMSDGYARSLSLTSLEEYLSDVDTDFLSSTHPELVERQLDQQELTGFPVKNAENAKLSRALPIDEAILGSEKDFSLKSFGDETDSASERSDLDFVESFDSAGTLGDPDVHPKAVKEGLLYQEPFLDHSLVDFHFRTDGEKSIQTEEPNGGYLNEEGLETSSRPAAEISVRDTQGSKVRQMWVFRQVKLEPEALTASDSRIVHDNDTDILCTAARASAEEDPMGSGHEATVNCDSDGLAEEALAHNEQKSNEEKIDQTKENQTAERIVISDDRLYTISEASVEDFEPSLDISSLHSDTFEVEDDALIDDESLGMEWEDVSLSLSNRAEPMSIENESGSLSDRSLPVTIEVESHSLSERDVSAKTEDKNHSFSNYPVVATTEDENLSLSNEAVPPTTEDDSKYRDAATDAEDIKRWLMMLIREEAEARRTLEPVDVEEIQQILQRAQSGMSNHTDTDSTSSHSDSANLVTFEYIRRLWASRKSLRKLCGEGDDGSNLVTLDYLRKLFSSRCQDNEMAIKDDEPNMTGKPDVEHEADHSSPEDSTSVSEKDVNDAESLQSFKGECDVMNDEIEHGDQVQQEMEEIDEIDGVDETVKGTSLGATLNLLSQSAVDFGCPIVMDNGSGMMKAGLATEDFPSVVTPNVVGRPNYKEVMVNDSHKDYYVGSQAERYRGILKLAYPIEHGIVTDWKDMERIWEYVFTDELRLEPEEHPVLMTEAPFNPKRNRERMLEIMMEVFRVPAFYVAIQAVLALYSSGRTTGIVLDSGDGVTHIVPVADGYSLPHASERTNIAGRDITQYLMKILMESGYTMKTSAEQEICRRMKEELCYVAIDYERALKDAESFSDNFELYTLPDGQIIRLSDERFRATEILFRPHLIGQDVNGIHEDLNKSIHKCDIDIRADLYRNVVLSGGTTMLPGLDKRLLRELSIMRDNKDGSAIKVVASADRRFSVWAGGAALAILPTFSDMWISSDDYFEHGVNLVHAKCF